eukprot:c23338_g1_i2 orf=860-2320(-)
MIWAMRLPMDVVVGHFVSVQQQELPVLLHAFAAFFCLLSAYFIVLPLRDEAAISLGTSVLPTLFTASLLLTLLAAPMSSYFLSLPRLSKTKALLLMYRFFGGSLILFFILYSTLSVEGSLSFSEVSFTRLRRRLKIEDRINKLKGERDVGSIVALRICFFIWIALLNLFTTSAMWARLSDVMNSEAGSRLFGFVGAGATLGQLAGSVLAVVMAPLGPLLLLLSAVLMEFAARFALCIGEDTLPLSSSNTDEHDTQRDSRCKVGLLASLAELDVWHVLSTMLGGLQLILTSSYLLHVCFLMWLTAMVSSFFYFQRAIVVAGSVQDPLDRQMLFGKINSLTAVFILFGQLTVTGRLLTTAGVTAALCASPMIAFVNMATIAISPTVLVVAISEASRKVVTYVVTRPGREVLFTVISREEKYKAKVCIDTFIQRLGDAAAAGIYKLLGSSSAMGPSAFALCALPVCLVWLMVAVSIGRRQTVLAKSISS